MRGPAQIALFIILLLIPIGLFGQQSPEEDRAYEQAASIKKIDDRIAALEKFLVSFPDTTRKQQVLRVLMREYQETRSSDGIHRTAERLVQIAPEDLNALGYLVYFCSHTEFFRSEAEATKFDAECDSYAERGLQALTSKKRSAAVNTELIKPAFIFHQWLGRRALLKNDYPTASEQLQSAVDLSPNDFSAVYPLALAYLKQPQLACRGLWYVARSGVLAPTAEYREQVKTWAEQEYVKLHGSEDGWKNLFESASRFSVKPREIEIVCR